MSYKVLARKWRPQHFRDMLGQESVLRALVNALDNNRLHHAYLFTGMRGVGKTTIARIFAKCLNCETNGVSASPCGECSSCKDIEAGRFFDLIEVDAASRTKVEETRELLENVPYAPSSGRYKVYLIDEVHMFSNHSFNALLKTLEEPPEHVKFLLATTDPQKVPVTVLSRCLQFNLRRMAPDLLADYLDGILTEEAIEHERPALDLIARASEGSVRDALSLVEQAAAFGEGSVRETDVETMLGRASVDRLLGLIESLGASDLTQLFERVEQLAEYAPDFHELMGEILSLLHRVAMLQSIPGSVTDNTPGFDRIQQLAGSLSGDELQLFYQIGTHARRDMPFAPDVREAFDMALLRMHAFRPQGGASLLQSTSAAVGGTVAARASAPASAAPSSSGPEAALSAAAGKPVLASDTATAMPGSLSAGASGTAAGSSAVGSAAQAATPAPSLQVRGEVSAGGSLRAAALAAARGEVPEPKPDVIADLGQPPVAVSNSEAKSTSARVRASASASESKPSEKPQTRAAAKAAPSNAASSAVPDAPDARDTAAKDISASTAGLSVKAVPTAAARAPIDRDNIQAGDWHKIVEELDISGMPRQLASHTQWVSCEADLVQVKLESGSEHLNTPRFAERVQSALCTWMGRDIRLTIDTIDGELHTPARIDEQNKANSLAAARVSIVEDPVVRQLIEQVDGAVDESSIQPLGGKGVSS